MRTPNEVLKDLIETLDNLEAVTGLRSPIPARMARAKLNMLRQEAGHVLFGVSPEESAEAYRLGITVEELRCVRRTIE